VRFKLILELNSPKALNLFSESGWQSRIKNEVILAMKDRFYDDLRTAEGILEASQDLTRRINAMMPLVDGRAPVKRVLFEEFMLQ
jgi:flagellar FliL protein